jgi:signal transduction histidine kinase
MQWIRKLHGKLQHISRTHFDSSSLQFRLTIEVAALAIFGLGSVAIWTSWKMQQLLIASHLQNVQYIASRFSQDATIYSDMLPVGTGLQKTIDTVTVPNLHIWVKGADGKLLAQSANLNTTLPAKAELMSLTEMPIKPQVYPLNDRYLVLCEGPVSIKGAPSSKVYIALDVTHEQNELTASLRSLVIVCSLALVLMVVAIALRIRRSLQPLQEMSQMAGMISADDLGKAKLQLRHAPREVKELAQAFNMMLSRLFEAWEQQRQFVSNVSHELRTPLTIVSGYLQSLLRRSPNLTDHQREALLTAQSEADLTIRLLQELLDLARADSGYMHFNLEPLILNDLLLEVTGMAEKFSHRSVIVNATEIVEAITDRARLRQVLINLIDNAVKYSSSDEAILLEVKHSDKKALIRVSDRGVGIPLQDQSRIFERFYRVDESRARSTGGHGLGLAIVKTLVEGMKGEITVRSQPGEGSTFTIVLPRP